MTKKGFKSIRNDFSQVILLNNQISKSSDSKVSEDDTNDFLLADIDKMNNQREKIKPIKNTNTNLKLELKDIEMPVKNINFNTRNIKLNSNNPSNYDGINR